MIKRILPDFQELSSVRASRIEPAYAALAFYLFKLEDSIMRAMKRSGR
jgi:hypothetical protein